MKYYGYACSNCGYCAEASLAGWSGQYCSRTVNVSSKDPDDKSYLVTLSSEPVYMIVHPDFLCNQWKPKE